MAKIKSFSDLEQSKKLAEILPVESADMKILPFTEKEYRVVPINDIAVCDREDEIPCWLLAALLNLLPSEFTEKGKYSTTTYKINIRKYKFTDEVNVHQIAYGSYKWYEDGGYT